MLNRDEVERLIRISRDQHMDREGEYESAYKRVDAIRGHKARMDELLKIENECKTEHKSAREIVAVNAIRLLRALNSDSCGECKLSGVISCRDCPFNLTGPCALKSVFNDYSADYPRSIMKSIANGEKAMAYTADEKQTERIKKALDILLREEGKPLVP